jgi:hypothetical protein
MSNRNVVKILLLRAKRVGVAQVAYLPLLQAFFPRFSQLLFFLRWGIFMRLFYDLRSKSRQSYRKFMFYCKVWQLSKIFGNIFATYVAIYKLLILCKKKIKGNKQRR